MSDWLHTLLNGYDVFAADITALMQQSHVPIADADVPNSSGVYMFLVNDAIRYIGEAKGSGGLRDRILRKHLSGDESHILQKSFEAQFPDRAERREYIKQNVHVKWVVIHDSHHVAIVERLAIWLFNPPWNSI